VSEPGGLPLFLGLDATRTPSARTYGTLSYNQRRNCWW
jgi:hypothetical protein